MARTKDFYIRTKADKYGGAWLVIRKRDWGLMHSTHSVFRACHWVAVWGSTPLAQEKRAQPVSEAMQW